MMSLNVTLTKFAFNPSSAANALPKSTSHPSMVCPSAAIDSSVGYVASIANVSVPFDLIAAGTSAAAADPADVELDALVVPPPPDVVFDLLLEHPARASDALVTTATVTASIRERCDIQASSFGSTAANSTDGRSTRPLPRRNVAAL